MIPKIYSTFLKVYLLNFKSIFCIYHFLCIQVKVTRQADRRGSIPLTRMVSLLAACLIIGPSTVFAFTSLADEIYGSLDTLKKQVISVSLQEYSAFGLKLSGAKDQLGEEKYAKFITQVKKLTVFRVTYGKSFMVDDTVLTVEKRKEYKQVLAELQPYFDQLNGDRSSREVLSNHEG
jgi:hypothetical protein